MEVSCNCSSSKTFTIFTIVNISLFLIHSSGTAHSAIALANGELTNGDMISFAGFQLDYPREQINHI